MRTCVQVLISGKVQGVYFRQGTLEMAEQLELDGWVRNLPDGRVEALLEGAQEPVEQMLAWLGDGPEAAEVAGVEVEQWPAQGIAGFVIRR